MKTYSKPPGQAIGRETAVQGAPFRSWTQRLHWRRPLRPVCEAVRADVVLTREQGKNGKLGKLLDARNITWTEVPLIETASGPDRSVLPDVLRNEEFEWITITSPEAASVFLAAWKEAGKPKVAIAVVGAASGVPLERAGESELLQIKFTPTKANAKHLSAELPLSSEPPHTILYPASAKAGEDLETGLAERGCSVRRLDTYNTVPVASLPPEQLRAAREARVLTIASPSAVEAWLSLCGNGAQFELPIACIGRTSAVAAERLGFKRVFYPDAPGLEGFVQSIEQALESCKELSSG